MTLLELCNLLKHHLALVENNSTFLHNLEASITVEELHEIINTCNSNDTANQINLGPFKLFLANRWQRIRGTDLSYPHAPEKPLTLLCIALAEKLANYFLESRYQLMMPTLKTIEYSVTLASLEDQPLRAFILNDDDTKPIDVLAALQYADEDGDLKHSALLAAEESPLLTAAEASRIRWHSPITNNYRSQQQQILSVKKDSNSIGFFVNRLINDLKTGDAYRGYGSELDSGTTANIGILRFSLFLETLGEEEKTQLFSLRADQAEESLGECWNRLCRSQDTNYRDTQFCVANIANQISKILNAHPELYQLHPNQQQAAEQVAISDLIEIRKQSWRELANSMQNKDYPISVTYGYISNQRLQKRIFANKPIYSMIALLASIDQLIDFLQCVPIEQWTDVLNCIDAKTWKKLNPNIHQFCTAIMRLAAAQRQSFLRLLPENIIQSKINNASELGDALNVVAIEDWEIFMRSFTQLQLKAMFHASHDLDLCLRRIHNDHALKLLTILGKANLVRLFKSSKDLFHVLNFLNAKAIAHLFSLIGKDNLSKILGSPKEIDAVLEFIPHNERMALIHLLDKAWIKEFFKTAADLCYIFRHLTSAELNNFLTHLMREWFIETVNTQDDILYLFTATTSDSHQWIVRILADKIRKIALSHPYILLFIIKKMGIGQLDFLITTLGQDFFYHIYPKSELFFIAHEQLNDKTVSTAVFKIVSIESLKTLIKSASRLSQLRKLINEHELIIHLLSLGKQYSQSILNSNIDSVLTALSHDELENFISFIGEDFLLEKIKGSEKSISAVLAKRPAISWAIIFKIIKLDSFKGVDGYDLINTLSSLPADDILYFVNWLGIKRLTALESIAFNFGKILNALPTCEWSKFINNIGLKPMKNWLYSGYRLKSAIESFSSIKLKFKFIDTLSDLDLLYPIVRKIESIFNEYDKFTQIIERTDNIELRRVGCYCLAKYYKTKVMKRKTKPISRPRPSLFQTTWQNKLMAAAIIEGASREDTCNSDDLGKLLEPYSAEMHNSGSLFYIYSLYPK